MSGSKLYVRPPLRFAAIARNFVRRRAYLRMLFKRVAELRDKRFSTFRNTADNATGLSVFEASTVREYARALPESWRIKGSANDAEAFEAFDPNDLPRFLNNPYPAGPDQAPCAPASSVSPGRLAGAGAFVGSEVSLLREKFRRQVPRSTIEVEAFAYIAAFTGMMLLVWACALVLQYQPKVAQRHSPAGASAQQTAMPPRPVAAARRRDVRVPSGHTAPASDHAAVLSASVIESRLNFAPHFEKFGFQNFEIAFQPFPDVASAPATPDKTAVTEPDPPARQASEPQPTNVGYVVIRNLGPETSLPLGTRVSATDWALAQSDVSALIMAFAKSPDKPITAEFEFFNNQGVSTGASLIEIRHAPDRAITLPVKAPAPKAERPTRRQSVRRSSKRPLAKPAAAANAAVQPQPTPKATASPPAAAVNKPGSVNWPPSWSLWPSAPEPSQPSFGFSGGQ